MTDEVADIALSMKLRHYLIPVMTGNGIQKALFSVINGFRAGAVQNHNPRRVPLFHHILRTLHACAIVI